MPNWTTVHLSITGPDPTSVEKLIFNPETNEPDFEVLLPMPPALKMVISPVRYGPEGRPMVHSDPNNQFSKPREATEEEAAEIGGSDWYTWACRNWGTKWNACHTDPGSLTFATAWDVPSGWLDALERALPEGHAVDCYAEFECGSPPTTIHLRALDAAQMQY